MRSNLIRIWFVVTVCIVSVIALFTAGQPQTEAKTAAPFPLQLDHVFLWVTKGAPEAKAFENAGLHLQDHVNQHTGQGTASKTFIFQNVYLELIWIEDEQVAAKNAARSGIDMVTRSRWRETGASPFGAGLHRRSGSDNVLPFPVTPYWAEWMQPNTTIEFAQTVLKNNAEPMFFVVPDYISTGSERMQAILKERFQNNAHQLGISRISQVRIVTTGKAVTETSKALARGGVLKVASGKAPLLELTFDDQQKNKRVDLRPQVPVVLKY
ncbi:MAG TPA: VOC family protein [Pyrinomonadaceae bacterium]|nr:VOC family protein [Pyrinomonadaceae bacterium]